MSDRLQELMKDIKNRCEAPGRCRKCEKMDCPSNQYGTCWIGLLQQEEITAITKVPWIFNAIAALQAENAELREAQRWRNAKDDPPESGVHVLLGCEVRPSGRKYVCDGYYAAPKTISAECSDEIAFEYDEDKDEYFLLEGFYEVIKNWDDFSSIAIGDFVTHWMHLPSAPGQLPGLGNMMPAPDGQNQRRTCAVNDIPCSGCAPVCDAEKGRDE